VGVRALHVVSLVKINRCLLRLLLFFILSSSAFAEDDHFMTLADIHFDPFIACHQTKPCPLIKKLENAAASDWPAILKTADTSSPTYRKDTNYVLLTASFNAAKQAAVLHHAEFVVVLGDFLAHEFRRRYISFTRDRSLAHYQIFVRKTLTFIKNELANAFPDIDVYCVVGNNDSYMRNYYVQPNSLFFQQTATLWSDLIKTKKARLAMQTMFPIAGYYAVDLPSEPSLRLIVLNSVLFSTKAKGHDVNQAATNELQWLLDQLELAKKRQQRVLIALHIPPTIDVYAMLNIRLFRFMNLWKEVYLKRFESDLVPFSSDIVAILSGHLHSDWSQMFALNDKTSVAVSGTPSISPIFGNNPGFKIYTYSRTEKKLTDSETHSTMLNNPLHDVTRFSP
jgi:sphingomyelin phosphodiesterase acid-like 3